MTEISADDLNSLADKLDAMDLNDGEQAALSGLIERAGAYEPDVEGFGFSIDYTGFKSGADLSTTALKLGGGLGFVARPSLGYTLDDDPIKPPPP